MRALSFWRGRNSTFTKQSARECVVLLAVQFDDVMLTHVSLLPLNVFTRLCFGVHYMYLSAGNAAMAIPFLFCFGSGFRRKREAEVALV